MATYGTDLVVVATGADAESGTWTEFSTHSSGGTPAAETENFIQGTQSQSQTFGNATTGKSICFDALSDISASIPSGDVILAWVFMGAPTNMYSYASGGHRFGIGASVANYDAWAISGDDRPPNPYGGWWNVAVDPRHTSDYTGGTGAAGAWRFFGSLIGDTTLGIRVKIQKGNPHAVDGMLRGRGEIYCTGTSATFTGMSTENDDTGSRWGLFQDTGGGTFLWKGLLSFGQSGTSTTFSDSNKSIVVDDTPKTYPSFNKIEFNHVDSDVTLTNISFSARGTYAPGDLGMIDNGSVSMTGCSFNNMGSFTYLSNATVTSCTFNGCGSTIQGGATISASVFDSSHSPASIYADDVGLVTGCTFLSTGSSHAIELDTSHAGSSFALTDNTFTGYATVDGSTGSEVIYNNSAGSVTLNASGNTGIISVRNGAGAYTSVIADPATINVYVLNSDDASAIQDARVLVWVTDNANYFYQATPTSITGTGTTATVTQTAHGLITGDWVIIEGVTNDDTYNGAYSVTVTGTNTYTYTTNETISTSPATGTILTTMAVMNDLSAVSTGLATDSRTWSNNQPIAGRVRKSSAADDPKFKQGTFTGTIDKTSGVNINVQLVEDQ